MGWKTIESAPKDGTFVLIAAPGIETGPVTIGAYYRYEDRDEETGRFKKGEWYPPDWRGWLAMDGDGSPSWCEPTHWMELPDPPENKG